MALKIEHGKVVSIKLPKLSSRQLKVMDRAKPNQAIIKRATSRKYNIVYS